MKKKNIIICVCVVLVLIVGIVVRNLSKKETAESEDLKIVTSFYPIYIMTLNITDGAEGVELSNMAETYTGCIHDYTLTTSDLKKFENADIFIENGQGIENFSQKIIDSYPNVEIIESSQSITDFIEEGEDINAHFWTSIDNYILQVREIADSLKELDVKNADTYEANATKYIEELTELKQKYEVILADLQGQKVVSLNESFSYLFKFLGMEEILIETDHEQSSLSAETVKDVINEMNEENIKSIVIAIDDSETNATTIANETGATIYKLNDLMSGENEKNAYINDMEENLAILQNML